MSEKYTVTCPIFGLLGIVFAVLKLCGVIAWSWWWVLAPFWFLAAVAMVIIFAILLITSIIGVIVNPWAR